MVFSDCGRVHPQDYCSCDVCERVRNEKKDYTICDKCPSCEREYEWDNSLCSYIGCLEVPTVTPDDTEREITLHLCPHDKCVIAITVTDDLGSSVYIPSTKSV
jgi:hypothetical protein